MESSQEASMEGENSSQPELSPEDLDCQLNEIEDRLNQCFHDLYRAHMNLILNFGASWTPAGKSFVSDLMFLKQSIYTQFLFMFYSAN